MKIIIGSPKEEANRRVGETLLELDKVDVVRTLNLEKVYPIHR